MSAAEDVKIIWEKQSPPPTGFVKDIIKAEQTFKLLTFTNLVLFIKP